MDQSVLNVLDIVLATTRAPIAVLVKVPLQVAIHCGCKSVQSDVELAPFVQKRPFAVFLDYVRSVFAIHVVVAYNLPDLTKFATNCNAAPPIRVFTWLHNPQVFAHSRVLNDVGVLVWEVVSLLELCELSV